jgi:hypothetical protein
MYTMGAEGFRPKIIAIMSAETVVYKPNFVFKKNILYNISDMAA